MTHSNKRAFKWFLLFMVIGLMTIPIPVSAEAPYNTFTKNSWGDYVFTQSAYYPVKAIGQDLSMPDPGNPGKRIFTKLNGPKDLFITGSDEIYVADTGNNRIVHLSQDGRLIRVLDSPDSALNKPQGVFVTDDGRIYIADTGNQRVVLLNKEGRFEREYKRPDSRYLSDTYIFDPIKIVVDKRGFLYVATLGGYQGMLQMDPDGGFQGFYGTNQSELSLTDRLKKLFYSKEMYAKELSKLPGSVNSATIDDDGFIYTVTSGPNISKNQLKKLNFSGQNLLDKADEYAINYRGGGALAFGETRNDSTMLRKPKLIDVAVSPNGNMTVIDGEFNYVSQYDAYGNLLFFWSASHSPGTQQVGLPKSLAAIASGSDNSLLIADDQENIIHVYEPTEFGELVFDANALMLEGKYGESEKLWKQVLRYHSKFPIAQLGLAKAAYHAGDYQTAKTMFREAGVQKGYSDAYWQIRLAWFQKYFSVIATGVIIGSLVLFGVDRLTKNKPFRLNRRTRKRKAPMLLQQLKQALYILKHPVDGFTGLRFENKGSYTSAFLILVVVFTAILFERINTSFTFNKFEVYTINAGSVFVQTFAVWLLWVICHYLIGAIQRGEARFRDVFIGSAYCLVPLIIIGIPMTLLSNVMTGSEGAIYRFMDSGMMIWTGLLFFWKVQSLQNYSVGETVINILSTLFTMIVVGVLVFITFGLTGDLIDFVKSIYMEVKLR